MRVLIETWMHDSRFHATEHKLIGIYTEKEKELFEKKLLSIGYHSAYMCSSCVSCSLQTITECQGCAHLHQKRLQGTIYWIEVKRFSDYDLRAYYLIREYEPEFPERAVAHIIDPKKWDRNDEYEEASEI